MRWFEVLFKSGKFTRITSYSMLTAVGSYDEDTILAVKEVANGMGDPL